MATAPRLDLPGAFHHVMARGIDRAEIFRDDVDREDFLARLARSTEQTAARIHAWALQDNHAHLLAESGQPGLSLFMRKLLGGYARAFNRRHARVGYLFQGRFRSVLVEAETYFLELVRYIHLNPLRTHVVSSLEELTVFPWTGHATLLAVYARRWQNTAAVLERFGKDVETARRGYLEFVAAGRGLAHQPKLELGRPVRRTVSGLRIVEVLSDNYISPSCCLSSRCYPIPPGESHRVHRGIGKRRDP